MKKLCLGLAAVAACSMIFAGNAPAETLQPSYKSAYVCDAQSGTAVYSMEETKRLPIASMCKIMTLLLTFEAKESGTLTMEESVEISEHAAGMGGSQVFLQAGDSYTVGQLVKAAIVCSANDACVALAERVAGSEEDFIVRMNERAKELGADNTLFANCTGLPKDPQYSCAKDVAAMLRELISHKEYFDYSTIWYEDFAHPDGRTTRITNTNKLVKFYDGCDGGKTGYTNEAGSCLAATAKRGDTRIISVVIGADNSKARNAAVSELFDYAFRGYETKTVVAAGENVGVVGVQGSRVTELAAAPARSLTVFGKKDETPNVEIVVEWDGDISAPVAKGDLLGSVVLLCDGVERDRAPLVSLGDAPRYSYGDAFRETVRNWQ